MHPRQLSACAASLVLAGSLACVGGPPADPVVLALGDQAVTRSEFEQHLRDLEQTTGPVNDTVRRALLGSFLEERVLVLEARSRGLVKPQAPPEAEQRAVQELLAQEALRGIEVTDSEADAYYRMHAPELKLPETLTLRQILVVTESEARDVRRRVARDPKSFQVLAQTRSRGPEASAGGLMGSFSRGQLPAELDAVVFGLATGALSDVIASPLGYHVVRVEARQPARERSPEEARGAVREILTREKSDRAVRQYLNTLLARAKVNYEAANAVTPQP